VVFPNRGRRLRICWSSGDDFPSAWLFHRADRTGRHPRFVRGITPLANLLLEEIADDYDPIRSAALQMGTWQEKLPHIGWAEARLPLSSELGRSVLTRPPSSPTTDGAASPNETIADTHWYRPDFDQYLVEQAQGLGVTYLDEVELCVTKKKLYPLGRKPAGAPVQLRLDFD
jgi:hypothetical protein